MKTFFLFCFLLFTSILFAQDSPNYYAKGDSAYKAKDYVLSADFYEKHIESQKEDKLYATTYYNTACSFSLANNSNKAFTYLNNAIEKGWKSIEHIEQDKDFKNIHEDERWEITLEKVRKNIAEYEATLKYPEIRKEIRGMMNSDQVLRRKVRVVREEHGNDSPEIKELWEEIGKEDHKNTERMKEIIAEIGWPKESEVGDAASSAWLLVQHADKQPQFQKECLELLKIAVEEGEAKGSNYAYLYDRVHLALGQKQLYGSQARRSSQNNQMSFRPIEAEHLVNKRREAYDMGDLSTYAKRMGFDYEPLTQKEALKKEKAQKKAYRSFMKKGDKAHKQKDYKMALTNYQEALYLNGYFTAKEVFTAACVAAKVESAKSTAFRYLELSRLMGLQDVEAFKNNTDLKKLQEDKKWTELMSRF
ncbi:MAG: TPR end-of-group domain-containing protein [Chitinophagales bacterium]